MEKLSYIVALFCFSLFVALSNADISTKIGVNFGRMGNNLPSPYRSIKLLKSTNAGLVKLYDADHETLQLLSGTDLYVSIMVQNEDIIDIASNQTSADNWVETNIIPFYPRTMIRVVLVGNEVLSYSSQQYKMIWRSLVPAMRAIKNSIRAKGINNIKVGTPLAMDMLQSTFPPSSATFRPDISDTVMVPLLKLLNSTKSYFFVDVYPYLSWSADPINISLDYALFRANTRYVDPVSRLVYTNLLDQMLDSVLYAMAKLGYPNIKLAIAETGWPNAGDIDQIGANIRNAATYNRNLVQKITARPALGTPARPGVLIPTIIFSLFNENQKTGPGTERHWGLLYPNGTSIYKVNLRGNHASAVYEPLPKATNNVPYKGKIWCVAANDANLEELGAALSYICGQGNQTCAAISPGRACYEPVSVTWHASYAFSSYWAQLRKKGATCFFNGLARQTTIDPGNAHCGFASVTL